MLLLLSVLMCVSIFWTTDYSDLVKSWNISCKAHIVLKVFVWISDNAWFVYDSRFEIELEITQIIYYSIHVIVYYTVYVIHSNFSVNNNIVYNSSNK